MKRIIAMLSAFTLTTGSLVTIVSCLPPDNGKSRFGDGINLNILNSDSSKLWNSDFALHRVDVITKDPQNNTYNWDFKTGVEKGISRLYKNYLNWDEVDLKFSPDLTNQYNTPLKPVNADFKAKSGARTFKGEGKWDQVDIRPSLQDWIKDAEPIPTVHSKTMNKEIFDYLFPNNQTSMTDNQAKDILVKNLKLTITVADNKESVLVSATDNASNPNASSKFFKGTGTSVITFPLIEDKNP